MIKKLKFLAVFIFVVCNYAVHAQHESIIERLEFILFEEGVLEEPKVYSFKPYYREDTLKVTSRFINHHSSWKDERVSKICDTLRLKKAYGYTERLKNILKKHEDYFLNEWEPIFGYLGGPDGLWWDQMEILCNLDMTLSYLTMFKNNWTASKKYEYFKNKYLVAFDDRDDTSRVSKILCNSEYLKYGGIGRTRAALLSRPSIIDEFIKNDDELSNVIIDDILETKGRELSKGDNALYSTGLKNFFLSNKNNRIDSILLVDPELMINIGFKNQKFEGWKFNLPIRFYDMVLRRYRNIKDPRLIDILLDDIFQSRQVLYSSKDPLIRVAYILGDHLTNYKIIKRFIKDLSQMDKEQDIAEYIGFVNSVLDNFEKDVLLHELVREKEENSISSKTYDIIVKSIK